MSGFGFLPVNLPSNKAGPYAVLVVVPFYLPLITSLMIIEVLVKIVFLSSLHVKL
jgi:hypothetical protein